MLLSLRPDLEVLPVRGNVGTRLEKLDDGNYDALMLAAAGLERLGLEERITELLPVEKSLPAAGQGALGVECRADAGELAALLESLDQTHAALCVRAERAVSAGLGADCSAPLGAHARMNGDRIELEARLATPDGRTVLRAEAAAAGDTFDPEALGGAVAADLIGQGAADLLAGLASGKS
jgi:hydroxymethylbilane synthase